MLWFIRVWRIVPSRHTHTHTFRDFACMSWVYCLKITFALLSHDRYRSQLARKLQIWLWKCHHLRGRVCSHEGQDVMLTHTHTYTHTQTHTDAFGVSRQLSLQRFSEAALLLGASDMWCNLNMSRITSEICSSRVTHTFSLPLVRPPLTRLPLCSSLHFTSSHLNLLPCCFAPSLPFYPRTTWIPLITSTSFLLPPSFLNMD